jgi:glycosyltransferase involved in cell wall biosynthesis
MQPTVTGSSYMDMHMEQVIDFFKAKSSKCVAVFYDAIPYKMADIYPPHFTHAHAEYMRLLNRMDLIIPISVTSAKDLINFFSTQDGRFLSLEERIKVVDLPAEFSEPKTSRRMVDKGFVEECHILAVGTVEPRKNHEALVRAFYEAEKKCARSLRLTIIGGDESFDKNLSEKINSLIAKRKNITWIKNATDTQLKEMYEKADFTVFPSIEEGFGLPILESLWFGVPCLCSSSGQMAELAVRGGCEIVDVLNIEDFSHAIIRMATDDMLINRLKDEIHNRYFKTWREYATEISAFIPNSSLEQSTYSKTKNYLQAPYILDSGPKLSVCITTYNRSKWLAVNLGNLFRISKGLRDQVEIIICDNFSSDQTPDVVSQFLGQKNFLYQRNSANVGMLGNLSQTVSLARGNYIWLLGDDDFLHDGALEKILDVIERASPDLININYNYSADSNPPSLDNIDDYFANANKIIEESVSRSGPVKEISAFNENFYTAIYAFVVKRKHAIKIFNQDTSGAPFAYMKSCVPTSKYILSYMMDLSGYWIAEPQITINMNVSWGKYTPLWILERIPEVYDLAELNGVSQNQVDIWRRHTLQQVLIFFKIIFESKYDESFIHFDVLRFIRRSRHLDEFRLLYPELESIYVAAHEQGHFLATITIKTFKAAM